MKGKKCAVAPLRVLQIGELEHPWAPQDLSLAIAGMSASVSLDARSELPHARFAGGAVQRAHADAILGSVIMLRTLPILPAYDFLSDSAIRTMKQGRAHVVVVVAPNVAFRLGGLERTSKKHPWRTDHARNGVPKVLLTESLFAHQTAHDAKLEAWVLHEVREPVEQELLVMPAKF